jgi:Cu2+-exporting ATPase
MCCAGCQAVAQAIVSAGLEDFYTYRTENSETGQQLIPDILQQTTVYDNPAIQKRFVRDESANIREVALILEGITCAACVWLNERHLRTLPGVIDVQVNYSTHRARVRWDIEQIQLSTILQAISAIGYLAHPYDPARQQAVLDKERRQQLRRLGVAGALGMQIMMISVALYAGDWYGMEIEFKAMFYWVNLIFTVPILLYSAEPFFKHAWRDIQHYQAGMDVPVALAISLAFIGSLWTTLTLSPNGHVYYDSISMFVFLLLAGRYFELIARQRSNQAAESLVHLVPSMATRLRDTADGRKEELVLVSDLVINDVVLIRPGDNIPADGVIIDGHSSVDESLLTGESYPLPKHPTQTVVAGTINIDSPLQIRVTKVGADTVLSQILRLLERAQTEKPAITQLADKVASWFILTILIFAISVGWYWWQVDSSNDIWFQITLSVLVVTCPCALSLATPTAITAATSTLTRFGLLTTRGHALETLAKTTHVIFDKTGTLTEGRLQLVKIHPLVQLTDDECLSYAIALEKHSEHPIAHALLNAATPNLPNYSANQVINLPGAGLQGNIGQHTYFIGTLAFIAEKTQLSLAPQFLTELQQQNHSIVVLADSEKIYAVFTLADKIRESARELVQDLQRQGKQVILLSGDHQAAVQQVAETVGISEAYSAYTPAAKLHYVQHLQQQGAIVAMIGDGVNDAPVLAQAQVSIAMGNGTQVARASADMILLTEQLPNLMIGFATANKTLQIIRQNIFWAIAYNLTALPLAALGYVSPWQAALGMSLSSLFVVANALRLLRHQPASKK